MFSREMIADARYEIAKKAKIPYFQCFTVSELFVRCSRTNVLNKTYFFYYLITKPSGSMIKRSATSS